MLEKLRKNYRASSFVSKLLFAVTFTFAKWNTLAASTLFTLGFPNIYISMAVGFLLGVIVANVLPFLLNFALGYLKLYSVPRAEYILIAMLFFSANYLAYGILCLLGLLSPLVAVWGNTIFYVLTAAASMFVFFKVTANLYFNVVTKVYYFKVICIAFLVMVVVGGYLL